MEFKSVLLFMLSVVLLPLMISSSTTSNKILEGNETDDYISLVSFKSQLQYSPSSRLLSSWNSTTHYCSWYGVSCESRRHPQRVTALDLSSSGLSGSIPPSVANLTFLMNLTLTNNSLSGTIPPEIGKLRRLQYLDLSINSLHGMIPANLTKCLYLSYIDLYGNSLSGKIPVELGSLQKLTEIALGENSLIGPIPSSVGNISSLQMLDFGGNQLEGSIPYEIGNLKNLEYFALSVNQLTGRITSTVFNLSSLMAIALAENRLEGSLPPDMGITLPNLREIGVGGNHFEGPIPNSLPNASSLHFIDMPSNNYIGNLPLNLGMLASLDHLNLFENQLETTDSDSWEFLTSLANCSQLTVFSLGANNLSGDLPKSVANLSTNLQGLDLGSNKITGNIPPQIGNLVNLTYLDLGDTLLTGIIPESMGKLNGLQVLYLSDNMLVGNIPSSLGNLTQLLYLYLDKNSLDGSLSPSFKNMQKLERLYLSYNKIIGRLPKEIFILASLRYSSLSYNSFTGHIPIEVGSMKSLTRLYIVGNRLTGEIPSTLGGCQHLEVLNLEKNLLQGRIPSSIENLKGLQLLSLYQNNLSGPIPDFLESLSLTNLNLSFNHFEGEVPTKGIFRNATATSLQGNDGLCGGIPDFHLPSCPSRFANRRRLSLLLKILIPTTSILFLLLLFVCLPLIYLKTKSITETSIPPMLEDNHLRASYFDLARATDGFAQANLIGRGSYGSVYKGTLIPDNIIVAVKVFNLEVQRAFKSFIHECEALRNIRHRNLVKIITSCSSADSRGDDFKALVFEYMSNGNLDTWLHEKKTLTLIQRLNIVVDVADALVYLHHDCEPAVVHCDLKPSNILLDEDMSARIGDFGLARLLPEISKPLHDSGFSIGITGTVGYIAPEYGVGGRISTCADVYSYGILLLEMFTGMRPVNVLFKDGQSLYKFAEKAFPDGVLDIIDPSLLSQEETMDNSYMIVTGTISQNAIRDAVTYVIEVGLLCSKESSRERIDMRAAAVKLHTLRDDFIRNRENEEE